MTREHTQAKFRFKTKYFCFTRFHCANSNYCESRHKSRNLARRFAWRKLFKTFKTVSSRQCEPPFCSPAECFSNYKKPRHATQSHPIKRLTSIYANATVTCFGFTVMPKGGENKTQLQKRGWGKWKLAPSQLTLSHILRLHTLMGSLFSLDSLARGCSPLYAFRAYGTHLFFCLTSAVGKQQKQKPRKSPFPGIRAMLYNDIDYIHTRLRCHEKFISLRPMDTFYFWLRVLLTAYFFSGTGWRKVLANCGLIIK